MGDIYRTHSKTGRNIERLYRIEKEMQKIIYFFKRIWYFNILEKAYYILFANADLKLGEICVGTRGEKFQVLSKPIRVCKHYKYLIINIK